METLTLINGNHRSYNVALPRLVMLCDQFNDVALAHVAENTGLVFKRCRGGYEAQPAESKQIVALLLTYNFKTQYHNNADTANTIYLKSDHHIGFKVDSICHTCCKHNHVHTGDMAETGRMAC